ncbi:Replication factor A protein 2 [Smittium mucronatum]|uniref:Replication factor A protein 2 n=1 Tax=Smittium mucronatum TaxID=133383 RepID=A0A1R0GQQ6_9FUNG|nr:Replication factor A protein 2 [Smittium mucronatum]
MEEPEIENFYFGESCTENDISTKITPLNIKQLLAAKCIFAKRRFILENEILSYVELIGVVRSINTKDVVYEAVLEDETGFITIKYDSSGSNSNISKFPELVPDNYYKVIGQLTPFFEFRFLSASHISKISDFNEISIHGLNIILNYLQKYDKKRKRKRNSEQSIIDQGYQDFTESPVLNSQSPSKAIKVDDFLLEKIYKYISNSSNLIEGVHFNKIFENFSDKESSVIKCILDSLVECGAIYTLDDELHYRSYCG